MEIGLVGGMLPPFAAILPACGTSLSWASSREESNGGKLC
jgi:hypothetical protein